MDALQNSAEHLKQWCVEKALPYWADHAQRDDKSWVEHLKLDGTPDLKAERRWRVLARQVYVYAKSSSLEWYDGAEVAMRLKLYSLGLTNPSLTRQADGKKVTYHQLTILDVKTRTCISSRPAYSYTV